MRGTGAAAVIFVLGVFLAGVAGATPSSPGLMCLAPDGSPASPGAGDRPLVCFESTPLDDGLTRYDILIDPNSTLPGALSILVGFRDSLSQRLGLGTISATEPSDIDQKSESDIATLRGGYDPERDSFGRTDIWSVLNAFPDESGLPPGDGNQGFRGGEEGSTSYEMSLATPLRDPDPAPLARIVAMGGVVYEGVLSFQGDDIPISGVIPEPATGTLLALGLVSLGLAGRSRRR